jgi:hypothetical protein
MSDVPPIPSAIAAVPSLAADSNAQAGSGELLERQRQYIDKFGDWLRNLNRHDFMQAKKLLDAMMHAYAKHTMKLHSPPAKKDDSNVPGTQSEGAPDSGLPAPTDGDHA